MSNTVTISGKLKKVSLRYTPNGAAVCSVRFTTMYKSKKVGSKPTFNNFICEAWKETAESLAEKEGKLVELTGYLKSNFYEKPDGTKINQTVIVISSYKEIAFESKEEKSESPKKPTWAGGSNKSTSASPKKTPVVETQEEEIIEEEPPF